MNLFIHELLKVFLNKRILLLLVGLILLNGSLLYIQEHNQNAEREPSVYRNIYNDLDGMSSEAALEKLEKEYMELNVIVDLSLADSVDEDWEEMIKERYDLNDLPELLERQQRGEYLQYSDGIWSEMALYELVIGEVKDIHYYDDYLQEMDDEAQTLSTVSIFSKPDTFSHRNLMKTPRDFDHLRGNELGMGPSKGVQMATQFLATDLLGIFFLMVIVMQLMTKEKENESLTIIKTTYRGRGALVLTKLGVGIVSSIIVVLSFYGVNYFLAAKTYGFGPVDRYIQSIKGYISSPFEITILQYLSLFLFVKFLVFVLIVLLFFTIAIIARHSMTVYISIVAVLGVSGILYVWIPAASVFSFFKYINIVYFLNTYQLFAEYLNLNIFGYPFQFVYCFIISMVVGLTVFVILSYQLFCRQKHLEAKIDFRTVIRRIPSPSFGRHVGFLRHEAHKTFFINKALLILLAAIAFQYYTYEPMKEELTSINDYYYKFYMTDLEGKLTTEKESYLEKEEDYFTELMNKQMQLFMDEDVSSFQLADLSEKLALKDAFHQVLEQADYLRGLETESGVEAWFLYDQGYRLLTAADNDTRDLQLALLMIILMIACLTPLFTYEMQTEMIRLVSPTKHGRRKVFFTKLLLGFLISFFIYVLIYLPELYNVLSAYGTHALQAPVVSMNHLSEVPFQMTILQYLVFLYVIRFLAMILGGLIIYYLSVRLKSTILVAMMATGVLVLPILLALIHVQLFDYILLTPFLTGNVLFKEYTFSFLQEFRSFYEIFLIILFVVACWLFFTLLRKRYIRG